MVISAVGGMWLTTTKDCECKNLSWAFFNQLKVNIETTPERRDYGGFMAYITLFPQLCGGEGIDLANLAHAVNGYMRF